MQLMFEAVRRADGRIALLYGDRLVGHLAPGALKDLPLPPAAAPSVVMAASETDYSGGTVSGSIVPTVTAAPPRVRALPVDPVTPPVPRPRRGVKKAARTRDEKIGGGGAVG